MTLDAVACSILDTLNVNWAEARNVPARVGRARKDGKDIVLRAVSVHQSARDDSTHGRPDARIGGRGEAEEEDILNEVHALCGWQGAEVLERFENHEGAKGVPCEGNRTCAKYALRKQGAEDGAGLYGERFRVAPWVV